VWSPPAASLLRGYASVIERLPPCARTAAESDVWFLFLDGLLRNLRWRHWDAFRPDLYRHPTLVSRLAAGLLDTTQNACMGPPLRDESVRRVAYELLLEVVRTDPSAVTPGMALSSPSSGAPDAASAQAAVMSALMKPHLERLYAATVLVSRSALVPYAPSRSDEMYSVSSQREPVLEMYARHA
jgi:hypothetical protein